MVKRTVLAWVLLGALGGLSTPVHASSCTQDLLDCYVAAANIDNFWYRTAAGIDCEIGYAACLGQAVTAD